MTPFDLVQKNTEYWTRTVQAMQQRWADTLSPNLESLGAADQIETAFQTAANLNLQAWTQMAEMIAALPSWMHWPMQVPGRTMADVFDMMRPFPEFRADLSPAPAQPDVELAKPAAPATAVSAVSLTAIKGIGPKMVEKLNRAGIIALEDLATLSKADIDQLESTLNMTPGRIKRQAWVEQAQALR